MAPKRLGRQTVCFDTPPCAAASASAAGKKESEGPLAGSFDLTFSDSYCGQKSWEKAESTMLQSVFELACERSGVQSSEVGYLLSGDLLNQCVSSTFALRGAQAPFFGLFGACSTMAESLTLAAMLIDGGFCDCACAMTSSHFCTAERQFRLPLEYGGQRPPTAQWTVTGAGAVLLRRGGSGVRVTHATTGRIVDAGIKDAANMGAAMAPASAIIDPCRAAAEACHGNV